MTFDEARELLDDLLSVNGGRTVDGDFKFFAHAEKYYLTADQCRTASEAFTVIAEGLSPRPLRRWRVWATVPRSNLTEESVEIEGDEDDAQEAVYELLEGMGVESSIDEIVDAARCATPKGDRE